MTVFAGSSTKTPVTRTDAEVTRIFREKLAKSKLAADGIQIHIQNGIATLTGKTDIPQHKGTATRMARTAGAREVRNQIAVSEGGKQRMLDRMSQGRTRTTAPGTAAVSGANTGSKQPAAPSTPPQQTTAPAPPPVRRAQVKHQ